MGGGWTLTRYRVAVLVSVLLAGAAFHLAADNSPKPERRRFPVSGAAVKGAWSAPGLLRGRRRVIESKIPRPGLRFSNPGADTYWVRFFYLLDSDKPASAELDGKVVARLEPGGKWRRVIFSIPYAPKGAARNLSFRLPEGGRLYVRRVDFRNYLIRLGGFFSLKPEGGARAPAGALWWLLFGALLIAAVMFYGRGRENAPARLARIFLPAGALGLITILVHQASGYALHAHPAFIIAVFAGAVLLTAHPGKTPWRVAAGRLAVVSIATLVALALAEGALVIWDPPLSRPRVKNHMMYSPDFGWLNRPGAEGWLADIGYHIRINSNGHRGPEQTLEKPEGVFRILGLGDSFSFGWGVEEEHTFLRILEKTLRAKGHRVEVLNAAVPAWHSVQSLAYLKKRGVRFKPDLVLAEFFIDDVNKFFLKRILRGRTAVQLREEEEEVKRRKASGWSPRLYHVWFNYRKLKRAVRDHKRRNPYPDFESERKMMDKNFEQWPGRVEGLREMIAEWKSQKERMGTPFIMFYIPAGGALNSPPYRGEGRSLARAATAAGFPILDVTGIYEKHPAPRTLYQHPKDGHISAKGHALIAEGFAKLIIEGGYLKKPR